MTPKLKKIIIAIIILAILFVVYAVFIKADPVNKELIKGKSTSKTLGQEDAQALGNQIAQALLRIEQISLDKSIFTDAIYRSLQDRSKPISEEPIGRPNPFAPLGDMSGIKSVVRNITTASSSPATAPKTTPKATSTPPVTPTPSQVPGAN